MRNPICAVNLCGKKYLEFNTCIYQYHLSKLQGDDDIIAVELNLHLVWYSYGSD